jgi:hypothetical protein
MARRCPLWLHFRWRDTPGCVRVPVNPGWEDSISEGESLDVRFVSRRHEREKLGDFSLSGQVCCAKATTPYFPCRMVEH